MARIDKIQLLLISYLKRYGSIQLILPDGIEVEIGAAQTEEFDEIYCYVVAKRGDSLVKLDSCNISLTFPDKKDTIILDEIGFSDDGEETRTLEVL